MRFGFRRLDHTYSMNRNRLPSHHSQLLKLTREDASLYQLGGGLIGIH